MDTKELENEFIMLECKYKQLEEQRKNLMKQLIEKASSLDTCSITLVNGVKIVSWGDGSWEDIKTMMDAHYNGNIDITDYWKTGDTRRIQLSDGEFIDLVLIGSKHDDLIEDINGIGKAVFTVQTKNCLENERKMCNLRSISLWSESDMRLYLNTKFYKKLPCELQYLIKPVKKNTYRYGFKGDIGELYRGTTTTKDYIFLLSEMEVSGTQYLGKESDWGRGEDGIQYEYYKKESNRIKYLGIDRTSLAYWWLRSSLVGREGNSDFCYIYSTYGIDNNTADLSYGVAPAFCI